MPCNDGKLIKLDKEGIDNMRKASCLLAIIMMLLFGLAACDVATNQGEVLNQDEVSVIEIRYPTEDRDSDGEWAFYKWEKYDGKGNLLEKGAKGNAEQLENLSGLKCIIYYSQDGSRVKTENIFDSGSTRERNVYYYDSLDRKCSWESYQGDEVDFKAFYSYDETGNILRLDQYDILPNGKDDYVAYYLFEWNADGSGREVEYDAKTNAFIRDYDLIENWNGLVSRR